MIRTSYMKYCKVNETKGVCIQKRKLIERHNMEFGHNAHRTNNHETAAMYERLKSRG